jgi:hypothetical protein
MVERHAKEIAAERAEWKKVSIDRQKRWADFKREFAMPEVVRHAPKHSVSARADFLRTATQAAEVQRKPPPRDQESSPPEHAEPKQSVIVVKDGEQAAAETKGWRARRSAAERRADGSYRTRDRPSGRNGRSRERDPFEPR